MPVLDTQLPQFVLGIPPDGGVAGMHFWGDYLRLNRRIILRNFDGSLKGRSFQKNHPPGIVFKRPAQPDCPPLS